MTNEKNAGGFSSTGIFCRYGKVFLLEQTEYLLW